MCENNKKPLETAELTDEQLEQAAGGLMLMLAGERGDLLSLSRNADVQIDRNDDYYKQGKNEP